MNRKIRDLKDGDRVTTSLGSIGSVISVGRTGLFRTSTGRAYEIDIVVVSGPEKGEHFTEHRGGDDVIELSLEG